MAMTFNLRKLKAIEDELDLDSFQEVFNLLSKSSVLATVASIGQEVPVSDILDNDGTTYMGLLKDVTDALNLCLFGTKTPPVSSEVDGAIPLDGQVS